ncbi:MAG: glucosaminidase domain-containing protein [Enhydrobacter sp.]|nr:glucosaminidase domain-containing protein [Enhydrobacter sp.]
MTWRVLRTWPDPEMQRRALWVAAMMDAARATADAIGISCQAIVAQAALETGWGKSLVGTHNLFGIKASAAWTGKRVLVPTREVIDGRTVFLNDWFRDYDSFAESIADHLSFLKTNSRYRAAGVFDRKGDAEYFRALQRAGYATDPNYATQLMAVRDTISTYFLAHMTEDPRVSEPPPAVVPAARRPWLAIGAHGAAVIELQRLLRFAPADQDGWFGAVTRVGVMRFQNDNGLDVDGIVGDRTWAKLAAVA